MNEIVKISNLKKSYGEIKAVDNLSFSVKRGELFAFLGVNGAGKSTTISIISNRLKKDSGSVEICGENLENASRSVMNKIGVVFQNSVLDGVLSVRDNLECRAALYGITGDECKKRILQLAEEFEFGDLLKRNVKKLSGGQRRKIDIARALIHRPELLILDEPTTGLDPHTRMNIYEIINRLIKEEKLTVLLTTHYMEEANDADFVLIINDGKKAAEGTPTELKNKYTGDFITLYGADESAAKIIDLPYKVIQGGIRIKIPNSRKATDIILAHPELFVDYEIVKGRMDDVFIAVTGRHLPSVGQ